MNRRIAAKRLFWHHEKEAFIRFFAAHGQKAPPYPELYPEPCWRWWRANNG